MTNKTEGLGQIKQEGISPLSPSLKSLEGKNEWQPIETAPKDGTWILVLDPNSSMAWAPYGFSCWNQHYTGAWYWCEEDTSEEIFPTHWMPLPLPPEQSSGVQTPEQPVEWVGSDGASHSISLDYAAEIAKWVFDTYGDVPQVDAAIRGVQTPGNSNGGKGDGARLLNRYGNAERAHACAIYANAPIGVIADRQREVFAAHAAVLVAFGVTDEGA